MNKTEEINNNNHEQPREDAASISASERYAAIEEPIIDLANTLEELSAGATMTLDYDDPVTGEPLSEGERVIYCENVTTDQEALLLEVLRVTGNDFKAASPT